MSTLINVEDVMRLAFTAEEGCRGHVVSELDIYVAECRYLVPVIGRALYNKLLEGVIATCSIGAFNPTPK